MPRLTAGTERGAPIHLHHDDHGAGCPVVLVHGWPLSGRMREAQVPTLADAGYRVVTYDRRGSGASSHPWEGYDYNTPARDLHCLITSLGLNAATLVGFSMGGGEATRLLGTYGNRGIRRAVFSAAATPLLLMADDNPEGEMTREMVADRSVNCGPTELDFWTD